MKQIKSNQKTIAVFLALILVLTVTGCSIAGAAPGANGTPGAQETGVVGSTSITENVESSGTLNAAQDATLAWKTSGIVDEVKAKAGDMVQAGDVLASLALTSVPSNILAAQADLINAQQALDDLTPTSLAISQAEQKIAQAQDDVKNKQKIVDGLGTPASQSDIDQADATVLLAKIQLDKAWDRYKPYQNRPDNNAIKAAFYNNWAQAQQKYDQAVRRLNNLKGVTINPTDLELAKANLSLAQANLKDAQEKLAELNSGANTSDVAAAKARITASEATLSALSLTSPFTGEILTVDVLPGDLVSSGQPAFGLADRQRLHVDTMIDESDIHGVNVGDSAELNLDALPGVKLTGKVAFINPLGQTVSGNVKYAVRIDVDPVDEPMLLGATVDVNVQTGAPRQTLIVPVRAVQSDSNGEYVMLVQSDGSLKRIDIVSGSLQGDQVIVISGDLEEGQQVQLATAANEMFDRMQNMGQ